jgi:hypothetical protein
METKNFIKTEYQRRLDLVNDVNFRKSCVELVKKLGITAEEWNKNKAMLLLYFANEFCGIENKINKN